MLPELIEAAVRSDQQQVARTAFATLADRTSAAATPWALGIRARCQALLDVGSQAEDAYLEAISHVFGKLDVRSRTELAHRLPGRE